MKRTTILGFCFTALVALAVWAPNVLAYEFGSGCASCHSFTGTSHDNHNSMFNRDCGVCHVKTGDDPVVVDSCGTCHGGGKAIQTRHVDNYGKSCDGCHLPPPACNDSDGDGYGAPGDSSCPNGSLTDCNDSDPSINPGAAENCTDKKDNNCNELIDTQDPKAVDCPSNCTDNDLDTYSPDGGTCGQIDCNDNDDTINPSMDEVCDNAIDNDCDGLIGAADPDCPAELCSDYGDRGSCKADSRCNYSRKRGCYEVEDASIYTNQSSCEEAFGRWNKKKETCTIR